MQVDHGLSEELLADAFDVAKRVFDLPLSEKTKLTRNTDTNRGYDVLAGQALKGAIGVGHDDQEKTTEADSSPDLKEGYMIGPKGVDETFEYWGRFGHGTNVFPSEELVPGMEQVMGDYYDKILALATELMKVIALSLDKPEDTFDALCRLPAAAIRLLCVLFFRTSSFAELLLNCTCSTGTIHRNCKPSASSHARRCQN